MNTQNLALGLVIAVVAFSGAFIGGKRPAVVERVIEKTFGAAAGPEHFVHQIFNAGFTVGVNGTCSATSTTASVGTLNATNDNSLKGHDVGCIDFTVNQADVTLTLAASTTGWYPSGVGSSRELLIRNASTTASADIIIAAGTGINLKRASSTSKTIYGDTGADNYAVIKFVRQADTDINALLSIFTD